MTCREQDVVLYVFIHVVIDTPCAVILFSYVTFGFWAWHVNFLRGRRTFVVYCVMCTCVGGYMSAVAIHMTFLTTTVSMYFMMGTWYTGECLY